MLVLASAACLTTIDYTPYKELACAKQTFSALANQPIQQLQSSPTTGQAIRVGWAKCNITPSFPVRMAGYGIRKKFEGVHDSLWARAIVLEGQRRQVAIVGLDLMMVHPTVAAAIRTRAKTLLPRLEQIYFTASHTHHGHGGWAAGLVGWATLGGYDQPIFDKIVSQTVEALHQATLHLQPAQIGYTQLSATDFVQHRLDPKNGKTDDWLRLLKIQQANGKTALFASFSAHNNSLTHDLPLLSNDYVGGFLQKIEKKIDFALFAAGMVASHNAACGGDQYTEVQKCGERLADLALLGLQTIQTKKLETLRWGTAPLVVREPQLRITKDLKLRTWLFEALVGKLDAQITGLQLNEITMLGMPCDFSGELFSKIAKQPRTPLLITSFNGSYIGYVSDDQYFFTHHSEIRDMNWAAPESGEYFVEICKKMWEKLGENWE